MVVEHNFTNLFRFNFHPISDEAFRSSQPTMWQLRRMVRKHGIRTIINLKDAKPDSPYWQFEREQCADLGVRMVDVNITSRRVPDVSKLRLAQQIFETAEYPIWIHCKAGIDRTGIYAALYQYFRMGRPIEQTDQFRLWPFGHLRHSPAGMFSHYIEQFVAYKEMHPDTEFLDWAEHVADRKAIRTAFKPNGLASFINDYILRRE